MTKSYPGAEITTPRPLIPGVEIELAGQTYVIPPLTLGQLRGGIKEKMQKNDELVNNNQWFEALEIKSQVIAEAMRRNYPHLSDSDVGDILDLKSYAQAWNIVLGGTGLLPSADDSPIPRPTNGAGTPGISNPSTEPSSEPTGGPTTKSTVTH